MPDRGHVFRRAFSWLPSQFASQSDAPVGAPRQFGSTEHLSTEAIAAFVDGELRMNAHLRAAHHLSLCAQCAAEVEDQSRARAALRDSRPIRIPSTLLGLLSQIPNSPSPDDDAGRGAGQGEGIPSREAASGRVGHSWANDQLPDGSAHDRRKRR
ncbi:MAG: RNA polymerase subunit sigma-70 [Mycobacterium sp.]|nr:RNA polymerase subunit sigma-70 [Mycobacterium sp.]MBV9350556.1 RNA polymerase subunit sigma-70 [Mycobacterium sp.]